jgi:hypothetical protein
MFPKTGNPKDEAVFFAYFQARTSYFCLCNLLQSKTYSVGIYTYAWSIVDNASRYQMLMQRPGGSLKKIRNAFQHVEEKIDLYRDGSIPVFGSVSWWSTPPKGKPEFGIFPPSVGRTTFAAVMNNSDSYHEGISHLTLSALSTNGPNDRDPKQQILRLDTLVLEMGKEVCQSFGIEGPTSERGTE